MIYRMRAMKTIHGSRIYGSLHASRRWHATCWYVILLLGLPPNIGSDFMQIKAAGFLKITGAIPREILILGLIVDINQFIVFHIGFI